MQKWYHYNGGCRCCADVAGPPAPVRVEGRKPVGVVRERLVEGEWVERDPGEEVFPAPNRLFLRARCVVVKVWAAVEGEDRYVKYVKESSRMRKLREEEERGEVRREMQRMALGQ